MNRVALVAAVLLVAGALLGGAGSAGASSGLQVNPVNASRYPVRTYVLSLPASRQLRTRDVRVTENGAPVLGATLTPGSRASKHAFGVVLLLDTSYSMDGKPLAAAVAAAQTFVAQRTNPNEELGAIDFNRQRNVVLPLTTSQKDISGAFASLPKTSGGTHIYDAVAQAEAMLKAKHITSGSIVVLSDGADTGSTTTRNQVARAARAANTRIYTIGLKDASYKPATLKALAAAGHGQYAEANAQALAPLFAQLGQALSNEYFLRYTSQQGPNVPVQVDISVKGVGTAQPTSYKTPPLRVAGAAPTVSSSNPSGFWSSALAMILIALLVGAVIAFIVIAVFRPRRSGLPARMAEFISIPELQRGKGQGPTATGSGDGTPVRKSSWDRFKETLEIADIKIEPELIVAATFGATVLAFLLIYVATGSAWWALLALAVPFIAREWVLRTLARRRERFAEQLPDALQVVASALRSGHSFAGALAVVVDSGSEPMKNELQRVVADEQRGVPIQDSLEVVAQRMASREVEQLALVAELQREAGGNAAEVIDQVADTVRERFDLKRLIKTLTTQGRMSRWIVSALPVFIFIVISLENPGYFHPLTSTTGGKIVLGFAVAWAVAGSLVIKRIVEIDV